ncbi:MAG: ArsR/SmtB family transcription factor [Anaerolineales bacterium]|jgi:DNA-binding transcriptional ArsR family regulator
MVSAPVASNHGYERQAGVCRALSHPARLAILDVLRGGEQCVCHIEAALGLRQAYISQQLMVLREAGLVSDRRDGWNIFYQLSDPATSRLIGILNSQAGMPPRRGRAPRRAEACPCPKCNPEGKQ